MVKGLAPSEVAHLLGYLKRAGVTVKRIGSSGSSRPVLGFTLRR